MNRTETELLAPAGSFDSLLSALRFGANAVYIGGPMLQLRAGQTAFTLESIARAADKCHAQGARLYVAANAFIFPEELTAIGPYARELKARGVDAMIVSDIGALAAIRRDCPQMELHLSTQANCTNHETARLVYELGARRAVLARELSLEQIRLIRENAPRELELECFIHGAMCMAYSGRCMISAYLTGRSANRGGCAQSCRWRFALTEEKRPGEYFPVEQDPAGDTILSSRDLCALPVLDELLNIGISSLKIEGRMKTPYYVAGAVHAYRRYLDGAPYEECLRQLNAISHRPYSTGFYLGEIKNAPHAPAGYFKAMDYVGSVVKREGERITVKVKNRLRRGQTVEALTPAQDALRFEASDMRDMDGTALECAAVPDTLFTLPAPEGVEAGDFLRVDV